MTDRTSSLQRRALHALAAAATLFPPTGSAGAAMVERRLGVMGTTLDIEVDAGDREAALRASESAVEAIEAVESRLSTWRDSSELSRLNAALVGQPVALSGELYRDLALAARVSRETGGAFDPGVGALVRAWGLRTGGRSPSDAEIAAAVLSTGMRHLDLSEGVAVRLHPGLVLEEGGFGKGIALDEAIASLRASGAAGVIDLGGQVAVLGTTPRDVAIADPRNRGRAILRLAVTSGSVATSGDSERSVTVGSKRIGHILDPLTGRPARDFGSVTVWAESAGLADCLSTGLFVMGPDTALDWTARHPGVGVVVVDDVAGGLRVRAAGALAGKVAPLLPSLRVDDVAPPGPGSERRVRRPSRGATTSAECP